MALPETRYAKSGDIRIAYQVVGNGPLDLVFVPGFISNLDAHWEDPGFSHLMTRLGSFTRLIMLDKRGTGLSDKSTPALGTNRLSSTRLLTGRGILDRRSVGRPKKGPCLPGP